MLYYESSFNKRKSFFYIFLLILIFNKTSKNQLKIPHQLDLQKNL